MTLIPTFATAIDCHSQHDATIRGSLLRGDVRKPAFMFLHYILHSRPSSRRRFGEIVLTYRSVLSGFDRRVWLFIVVWGLVAFAYFGLIGVLLNLYLLRLGFGIEFIGLLIGTGQLVWGLAAFPSVSIGSRLGLRRALILALMVSALGSALVTLVEGVPASLQHGWLLASWMILWLGASLNTVSTLPYLASIARQEHRNYAFALRQTSVALFTILGSLVAGVLPGFIAAQINVPATDPAPYRMALMLVPLCFALASMLMIVTPPISVQQPSRPRRTSPLPLKVLILFGLVAILETASEGPLRAFFNVYMSQVHLMPTSQIGLVIAVANLVAVFPILITPRLIERTSSGAVFAIAGVGLGVSLLAMALFQLAIAGVLAYTSAIFAIATAVTARAPFSQEVVEEPLQPVTSAIITIAIALGWGITAIIGGYVIAAMGYGGLFVFSAGLAFASATLTVFHFVRKRSLERTNYQAL
jgi:predicted MFS family arabinose efflux permease